MKARSGCRLRLCGPGFDGGGQLDALVSLVDLPPTLLDAAGLPIPPSMEGTLDPGLLRREPVDWPEEVFIQISESQVARPSARAAGSTASNAPDRLGWMHAGSDRYVEEALYDLEADPHELENLVGIDAFRARGG